jgi:putative ABC transport system substrate-binding protein
VGLMLVSAQVYCFKVGVLWQDKSGMGDRVYNGIKEDAGKYGIELETYNSMGDEQEFTNILHKLENEKDAVVVLRSAGLKWAGKHTLGKKPIIGGACSNPKALGVVENLKKPEGNITACTYFIPPIKQIQMMRQIFPRLRTVGLLYQKGHPAGEQVEVPLTEYAIKKMGMKLITKAIYAKDGEGNKEECIKATKELISEGAKVIIITNTNSVYTASKEIVETAGNTPVFSFTDKGVQAGALGGLVADDTQLGRMIAESLSEFKNGKTVNEVEVKSDPEPVFYINQKKLDDLNLSIPNVLRKKAKII